MAYGSILGQTPPPSEAGVTSFNGRTGEVVPLQGDYTAEQVGALSIDGGTLNGVLNMGNNKITNIAPGTKSGDAVEYKQFNSIASTIGSISFYPDAYIKVYGGATYSGNKKYEKLRCFIPVFYTELSGRKTIFYLVFFSENTTISPNFTYYLNNRKYVATNYDVQIMYPNSGLTYTNEFVCTQPGYYIINIQIND